MKKIIIIMGAAAMLVSSCGNNRKCSCGSGDCICPQDTAAVAAKSARGEYKIADKAQTDISNYPVDEEGYITLFDGKTLDGAATAWTPLRRAGTSTTERSTLSDRERARLRWKAAAT